MQLYSSLWLPGQPCGGWALNSQPYRGRTDVSLGSIKTPLKASACLHLYLFVWQKLLFKATHSAFNLNGPWEFNS